MNKYNVLPMIIAIVFASVVGTLTKHFISGQMSKDFSLAEVANEANKSLPMMIDSETRADYTAAISNDIFAYYYTAINYAVNEINIDFFEEELKPNVLYGVKTSSEYQNLKKQNIQYDDITCLQL